MRSTTYNLSLKHIKQQDLQKTILDEMRGGDNKQGVGKFFKMNEAGVGSE